MDLLFTQKCIVYTCAAQSWSIGQGWSEVFIPSPRGDGVNHGFAAFIQKVLLHTNVS